MGVEGTYERVDSLKFKLRHNKKVPCGTSQKMETGLQFNKMFFVDLETTGLDKDKCGIHEISGIFRVNGKDVGEFDRKVCYHAFAEVNASSLAISGVTQSQIMRYPKMDVVYRDLVSEMAKHVDMTDPKDKYILAAYNGGELDKPFLKEWFRRNNGAAVFKAMFHSISLDIATLAISYMIRHSIRPANLKLGSVAKVLGIEVQEDMLHRGFYDAYIAQKVYDVVK